MNRLIIGVATAAATLTAASNASAADMPVKAPRVAYDPCGAARFTGFYAGGNTGAVAYTANRNDLDNFLTDNNTYVSNETSWTAGVQIGYDWQSCNKVFGIVADWNWASATADTLDNPNNVADTGQGYSSKLRWFSTLRARAGLAVDDTLFYVTGGLAAGKIKTTIAEVNPSQVFTNNDTRWGLALGAGAEFALWNNWSVNTEVLYLHFKEKEVAFPDNGGNLRRFDLNDNVWVARLGLNYRWDNPRLAYAASLPVKAAAPIYGCGPQRFNGGYVGGNIGGVGYTADRNDLDGYLTDNGSYSATKAGFTAGAQIGWDWQNCHKVFGVVADWNWADAKANSRDEPLDTADPNQGFQSKLSSFGTIRARAGLVADDSMIYVTGGLAAAKIKTTITEGSNVTPEVTTFEKTRWGLAAGVGAEFALWPGWSVNSELIYMQFSKQTVTLTESPANGTDRFTFDLVDSAWVTRVGLNYRWDALGKGPVAAKGATYPCGPQRFNGFYVGGNVGGVAYTSDRNDQDGFGIDNTNHRATDTAGTAGVQVGWDWQSCHRVLGVVADVNWSGAKTSIIETATGAIPATYTGQMDWFSTLRTRTGVVANDTLVYVTGGLAFAKIENTYSSTSAAAELFTQDNTRWGWTGGVGAEFLLADGWSANAEVLYMAFRKETVLLASTRVECCTFENYDSAWVGRVGLNYRWGGGGKGPVMAKN